MEAHLYFQVSSPLPSFNLTYCFLIDFSRSWLFQVIGNLFAFVYFMILVIIRMKISPARRLALSRTISSLVDSMRIEPGCRRLNFCKNVENENELYLLEEWENRKMLKNHLISEPFKVLRGAMNMLQEACEMEFYTLFHPSGIAG